MLHHERDRKKRKVVKEEDGKQTRDDDLEQQHRGSHARDSCREGTWRAAGVVHEGRLPVIGLNESSPPASGRRRRSLRVCRKSCGRPEMP